MITPLLIGFAAGILSGLLGIGGGIILIPAFVALLGFSQHKAQGTSLAALVLPVGIFAAYQYYKQGHLDVRVALLVALGLAVGAYCSSLFVSQIPEILLKRMFGLLLAFVAAQFLFIRGADDNAAWLGSGVIAFIAGSLLAKRFTAERQQSQRGDTENR